MQKNNHVISTECLTVQCGSFILDSINLTINKNEIFAVLGKTGSGKTVFLEAIAGFHKHYTGSIRIFDMDAEKIPLEKRTIGFVYQDYGLFPHLNVFNNIAYGLKITGISKPEITKQVNAMAQLLSITNILKCYPDTLSGGEKQRTAIARSLILRPKLLLLDEPFSALDPKTKQRMYKEFMQLHKNFGCTTVFVTHDFYEAQSLADRVGILLNGKLSAVVESERLFSSRNNYEPAIKNFLGLS